MKDVESLIEHKEQLIRKLQGEIDVLRAAAKIMAQEAQYSAAAAATMPANVTTVPRPMMAQAPAIARASDASSEPVAVAKQFL